MTACEEMERPSADVTTDRLVHQSLARGRVLFRSPCATAFTKELMRKKSSLTFWEVLGVATRKVSKILGLM